MLAELMWWERDLLARNSTLPAAEDLYTPRVSEWWERDLNPRRQMPLDLQSSPVGRLGIPPVKGYFIKNEVIFLLEVIVPNLQSKQNNFLQFFHIRYAIVSRVEYLDIFDGIVGLF